MPEYILKYCRYTRSFVVTSMVVLSLISQISAGIQVPVSFNASTPLTRQQQIFLEQLSGASAPAYNNSVVYSQIQKGLAAAHYTMLRFPGGAVSNYYHWNGSGSFSSVGEWIPSSTAYSRGFTAGSKFRGTSQSDYFSAPSLITDNDTNTFWWSDPFVTKTFPWVYLEFPESPCVDSLVIYWGKNYAIDFDVAVWDTNFLEDFEPYQEFHNHWTTIYSTSNNTAQNCKVSFTNPQPSYQIRVRIIKHSGDSGIQIREIYAFSKGKLVSINTPQYEEPGIGQTRVVACGTHFGSLSDNPIIVSKNADWDFEAFIKYCKSFPYTVKPVVNVNFSTGTPAEAAQWVTYSNVIKGYGVRYWAVGAEPDGAYNDCTPVSAGMFAEKFILFARAMKKADPAIKICAPVLSTADFDSAGSAEYNDTSWMETFLAHVGAQEKKDDAIYLDGVDFMNYPYWFDEKPDSKEMLAASDDPYEKFPILLNYINKYLPNPDSVFVYMCEFNIFPGEGFSLLNKPITGACIANMYAGFAEQFTRRSTAAFWESFKPLNQGTDGTFGALTLFNEFKPLTYSSFFHQPSAQYWALYTAGNIWLEQGINQYIVKGTYDHSGPVRAYGAKSDTWFHILLINLSLDSATARVNLQGAEAYTSCNLYTWGDREFFWPNDAKNSFAAPNSGPSCKPLPCSASQTITLPPCALAVLQYNSVSKKQDSIQALHYGAYPVTLTRNDSLNIWATFNSSNSPITAGEYRIDTVTTWLPLIPLDGNADGIEENFTITIPRLSLPRGTFPLYLRAKTCAAISSEYGIPLTVTGVLQPVILIDNFEDNDMISSISKNAFWYQYVGADLNAQFKLGIENNISNEKSLKGTFTISEENGYDNAIHIILSFPKTILDTIKPVVYGLQFSYASSHSQNGIFTLAIPCTSVKDYDEFKYQLRNTNATRQTVRLRWQDFTQSGWGVPVTGLTNKSITHLDFTISGRGTGFLAIDDIACISDSGTQIIPVLTPGDRIPGNSPVLKVSRFAPDRIQFSWTVPSALQSTLSIYTLQEKQIVSVGPFQGRSACYTWNVHNDRRYPVAKGVYVVKVNAIKNVLVKKFVIVR